MYNRTVVPQTKNSICLVCLMLMASGIPIRSVHGQAAEGTNYYVISITIEDERQLDSLSKAGLTIINNINKKVTALAREAHLTSLNSDGWQYDIKKGPGFQARMRRAKEATTALTLNNGIIIVDIADNGTFTMRRAVDGKWLLYPRAGTGFFSVNIDGTTYSQGNNTLLISGPLTMTNLDEASISNDIGSNVRPAAVRTWIFNQSFLESKRGFWEGVAGHSTSVCGGGRGLRTSWRTSEGLVRKCWLI